MAKVAAWAALPPVPAPTEDPNGEYKGDDPIGILMADFRERDPGKIRNKELADRVYDLKNREDEVRAMCRAMEITFEEGRAEGRLDQAAEKIMERIVSG